MKKTTAKLPGSDITTSLLHNLHLSRRTSRYVQIIGAVLISLSALFSASIRAHADTFPVLQSPPSNATVDGCSGCLFKYTATPAAVTGQAITSWSFYAMNTHPVTPVIFNSAGVVVGIGTTVTPTGVGLQTDLFGRTSGTNVIAPGDSVGWFYAGQGSIAVSLSGGPGVIEGSFGGIQVDVTQINTSSTIAGRTYYVSYTSQQVALNPASAPGPGAISDGCQYCLFQYTPVTSQYNGAALLSWDFYALNTNAATPVIFNSDGLVIGYGQADTPTATGFQSFAYLPAYGTDLLQTGDYLGWYYPGLGGPIAFTSGGQGGTYAAFPVPALGPNDVTTTPITGRDYSVGFETSQTAITPEPSYIIPMIMALGISMFYWRNLAS